MLKQTIENNVRAVRAAIEGACRRAGRPTDSVTLVCVTKTVDAATARILYEIGERDLAENRPQALWEKQPQLPADARWHLIGHLQTNKVRRTLPLVEMIHSVDSVSLAQCVSSEAVRIGRPAQVLLETNVTGEESKHGFSPDALRSSFGQLIALPGLQIAGLMTMARLEDEVEACRPAFAALRLLRDELRSKHAAGPRLDVLSMGMSRDFVVAIEEGATHVRIGSALFEGMSLA